MSIDASFFESVSEELSVNLFGKPVKDLGEVRETPYFLSQNAGYAERVMFASIYGVKMFGACVTLPRPVYAVVPAESKPADDCGYSPKEFRMWTLPKGAPLMMLRHDVGVVEDIASDLKPFVDVQAQASVHDIHLSGD